MPPARFKVYRDKNDKFRFILQGARLQTLAVSEAHETKPDCLSAIRAIQNCHDAKIDDLTIDQSAARTIPAFQTTLILENPLRGRQNSLLEPDSTITFRGKLLCGDAGVSNAQITLYDSDRGFLKDDPMAWGLTQTDGSYQIRWRVQDMDSFIDRIPNVFDTVEVYAKFTGSSSFQPAKSKQYTLFISKSSSD
ncbi:MAG: DUF1508 domain-containing protein [Candidatus Bathyarchaeota archaeon]|nr:DUF1508 domain-containing protein [Candidatus Bathyarchaeota archaeon]